ncbi:hypothetical protein [Streptomyces cyslabdanicus]|uniref:hypothetical protein n=1 Tax=Streptomyces cyslabdanicus TaxID=1470456 RepID=UPI004043EB77
MFVAVIIGVGGVICMASGLLLIGRQHRRRADTRAGWGAIAIGLGQLFRAVGSWAGRQPLGFILAACCLAFSIAGFILVARDRDIFRNGRGGRKRRKLPPLHP